MVPGIPRAEHGLQQLALLCGHSSFMNIVTYRMLCFVMQVLERITPYTFISRHTKISVGSVYE